ncbi:MAG: type I-C CRISPR-associated protein Cas8c/Csd1 [Azospirillaceae bacterium]
MTILQALVGYYDRLAARDPDPLTGEPAIEPLGYSREKISFAIMLDGDGKPIDVRDLRERDKKGKPHPRPMIVPAAVKRSSGIAPNLLWDKSSYMLGRTAGECKRVLAERDAFRQRHLDLLAESDDPGLVALQRFLMTWTPERFDAPPFVEEMLDANLVFRLDGDAGLIHEREAAKALVARAEPVAGADNLCLVTGRRAAVQRLHPSIRGVDGAQSSGASLVSFNIAASESHGKEQGDNAPTSAEAAFKYGAALNRLLDRADPRHRLAVGDTTVVFWAEASGAGAEAGAAAAEDLFGALLAPPPPTDEAEAAKLNDALGSLRHGRPVDALALGVESGTRFHVLGLAPNAARLSVRFWLVDTIDAFAARLAEHHGDLDIAPRPWQRPPSVGYLLRRTAALQAKADNVPPLLGGEVLRAILAGTRYPRALLAATIMRLRAGDDPGEGWHAAACRAVLAREARLRLPPDRRAEFDPRREGLPVSLDRDNSDPAYQLGRLFAALETGQRMALGRVNATIRDRYFGAASATPAGVFPLLLRGVQAHLGKLRKSGKDSWLEREIEQITTHLPPSLPRSLKLEAQGRFALGYYHQRAAQFADRKRKAEIDAAETEADAAEAPEGDRADA